MRLYQRRSLVLISVVGLMSLSNIANAACDLSVQSFSIDTVNYDPLSTSNATGILTYSVKNVGSSSCAFKTYFCALNNKQVKGAEEIEYRVTEIGSSVSLINSVAAYDCPVSDVGLSAAKVQTLGSGVTYTSSNNFEFMVPHSQFSGAGQYIRDIGLAVYNSSGQKVDHKVVTPATNMDPSCDMPEQPTSYNGSGVTYSPTGSYSGGTVNFSGAIDSQKATLKNSTMQMTFSGARCNYTAHVSVKSQNGGMQKISGASSVSGGFLNKIDYTATVSFCGTNAQISTQTDGKAAGTAQCSLNGINQTNLNLTLSTAAGNTPLLAGQYEDILTIQIGQSL